MTEAEGSGTSEKTTLTPSEQSEATLLSQDGEIESKGTDKHIPFFEKEVSEAELMGEEAPVDEKKETVETTKEETTKEAESEDKESEEEAKPVKPPAGFVPKQALAEEREKRKALQEELDRIKAKPAEEAKQKPPEERTKDFLKSVGIPEDFKVLTDSEEDAMMEEDIFAYNKYQRNLRKYEKATAAISDETRAETERKTQARVIIETAVKKMEEAVPGIHEEGSEINKKLTDFAVSNGFENGYLSALTDPKTMFLPSGAKEPMFLGEGAAALVKFINSAFQASDISTALAEKEKEIEKRVTAELMKKFKTAAAGKTGFQSLGDVPGSTDTGEKKRGFTELDFSKMSEEEQRVALGG